MSKKITYEENPWDDGAIVGDAMADFLPSPTELATAAREDTVKVTLALSSDSVAFFKKQAKKHGAPYQKMIRTLLDHYVAHNENRP